MAAPFNKDDEVRHKKDGRRAIVTKVHFQQVKGDDKKTSRKYTQVAVRVLPNDRVKGEVNSFWDIEDVMAAADYDRWAERRGVPTEVSPGPADDDKPQLENPMAVPPQQVAATEGEGE